MKDKIGKILHDLPLWYLIFPLFLIIGVLRFTDIPATVPVSEESTQVFNKIKEIRPGSKIMIIVNYGPEGRAELEESLSALITSLAGKEVGIIFATMIPAGIETISTAIERSLFSLKQADVKYVYGRDFIHLGYIAGGSVAAGMLAGNLTNMRVHDIYGNELKNMPVMNGVNSFNDLSGVFEFSSMKIDDVPGAVLISMFSGTSDVPLIVFCTADTVSEYLPFVKSGAIDAIAGGFKNISALTSMLDTHSSAGKRYFICITLLVYILLIILSGVIEKIIRGDK